jgi:hypothetical protein
MHAWRDWPRLSPPTAPAHVGEALRVGETALMRTPGTWFDVRVQVPGIDGHWAAVLIKNSSQVVRLSWLRRS